MQLFTNLKTLIMYKYVVSLTLILIMLKGDYEAGCGVCIPVVWGSVWTKQVLLFSGPMGGNRRHHGWFL